jgi:site-specific recombinase XerD
LKLWGHLKRLSWRKSKNSSTKAVETKPFSVNTYLRCLKAFMAWAYTEEIIEEPFKLTWLKEEQKILPTFTAQDITKFVAWKPIKRADCRLHALTLTALDTGLRVGELLSFKRGDVDFQNSTLRVEGNNSDWYQ